MYECVNELTGKKELHFVAFTAKIEVSGGSRTNTSELNQLLKGKWKGSGVHSMGFNYYYYYYYYVPLLSP